MKSALRSQLKREFDTIEEVFTIAGRELTLLRPRNADELISEADYVRDERLPYWADVWPSSTMLAERLFGENGEGRTLIELGCGAGLTASAAALAGFEVTATDYYEDALRFTQLNTRTNAGSAVTTQLVDWSVLPATPAQYDVVAAADVLYEPRYPAMVANAIQALLAPGGVALIADPGRLALPDFLNECRTRGMAINEEDKRAFKSGEIEQTITIYAISAPDKMRRSAKKKR